MDIKCVIIHTCAECIGMTISSLSELNKVIHQARCVQSSPLPETLGVSQSYIGFPHVLCVSPGLPLRACRQSGCFSVGWEPAKVIQVLCIFCLASIGRNKSQTKPRPVGQGSILCPPWVVGGTTAECLPLAP